MSAIERKGQLIIGVLKFLEDQPEGSQASEVIQGVKLLVPPTPSETGNYEASGTVKYDKILRFATIGPVKSGWLIKSKGIWSLTEEGKNILANFSDPVAIAKMADNGYRQWKASLPGLAQQEIAGSPAIEIVMTAEEADEQSWRSIHTYLATLSPYEFQDLFAALLRGMGYHIDWVAPPGPDGGIDVIAYADPLGAQGPRLKVQVKRRQDKISITELRSFVGVLSRGDVGIFASLNGFQRECRTFVNQEQDRRVILIDAEKFFELWIECLPKMNAEDRQRLPLRAIYFLNVTEDGFGE